MDDRRYLIEGIIVIPSITYFLNIKKPSDNCHDIIYAVSSKFFKKYCKIMRLSNKNKFILCDELYEINFNNNKKEMRKIKNILIEITSRAPNDCVCNHIPDNTFIMCASFGKINNIPKVQLGITEGAKKKELDYINEQIVSKPKNDNWKYVVATRGIQEELGIFDNVEWKCVNEQQYTWHKKKWVATLISIINY